MQLPVEMFYNLVQIGKNDKEGNRLVIMISKPDEILVYKSFCFIKAFIESGRLNGSKILLEYRPGRIIHLGNVRDIFFGMPDLEMAESIARTFRDPVGDLHEPFGEYLYHTYIFMVAVLLEVSPESVFLKEFPVVLFVIGHPEARLGESFYKKSPVVIILTKIYGSVHSLHSPLCQPFTCSIEKHERGFGR